MGLATTTKKPRKPVAPQVRVPFQQFTIRVSQPVADRIYAIAVRRGVSRARVMQDAITEAVQP